MKQKWPILIFSALLTAFIVLAGIWGNAQFERLHSGSVLTGEHAAKGIALDGWRQEAPGQWHFTFTVGEDIPSLTLCVTNTAAPLAPESLTSLERSGELYALDVTPGETVELVFTCGRSPQTWLMTSAFASRAFRFRTMTQLIALTAFVTMGMVLLALYHYKHLPELGYFLLYLVIMSVWALMVFFFPAIRNRLLQRILRSFFSLTVLASALLAAGLLGVKLPRSGRGLLTLAAGCVVFFALSMSSYPPLRVGMLVAGMCLCLYYLMAAVNADYEGAALMLLPGAVTTGFRVWALMVFFFPAIRNRLLQRILRSFFSLTVLASALLAAGLLGVKLPRSGRGLLTLAAGCVVFFALSMSSYPPLRVGMLVAGMCLCLYYLMAAVNADYEGAALMLLPGAVTTGFRVWALMPGLDSVLFVESVPFYLLRCARLYDLPFAIGCMVFVCRRFALLFDRTEQLARELDARVAERTKELTAETEARKSMMLNIFHDLRSPLFAVSGGLETLESAPEALPALLPALRQRIEFLRRLTEDLFLAAKLEQKQILLNEDRAALNEEAAAVCAACRSEADQKGVELHVSADTPLPVWGDSVRLQQIIQNLVTNAIHYTPAGGSIHVDCRAEGKTACVSVQDTGCGIAPEDQSAVFDRYFHTTADKKHDSTGLGLTIAQELAHLHHGEITLQSEVGKGSIFTLRLPLLTD